VEGVWVVKSKVRTTGKVTLSIASFALLATTATPTRAEEPRSLVIVGEGADGEELASDVAAHVAAPYRLKETASFRKALNSGRAPALGAALKSPATDAKLVARARAAAQAAHADAAILLFAHRSKRAAAVHVWLVSASGQGRAEVDKDVSLGSRASVDDLADAAWNAVAPGLSARSTPPSEVASAPSKAAADAPEAPESSSATATPSAAATDARAVAPEADQAPASADVAPRDPTDGWGTSLAVLRASIEAGTRNFGYVDRLTSTLRPYNLTAAPLAAVSAELYPLARTGTPVLKDFGATVDYAMAFGLASADSAGTSVSTSWSAFDLGVRERILLGRSVILGLHGGYGEIDYTFSGALNTTAELPSVQYRFVRGGMDGRVALGAVAVSLSGSYLGVLSTGPMGSYFGRATVGGVEGSLGVSHAFGHGFELAAEFAYTRFFYTLNPEPGDAYVAGGALDQMARGSMSVAYAF
jgi:hypothetical protein